MRLQLSIYSLALSLTSVVSASSLTDGVKGAKLGYLGDVDGKSGDGSPVPLRRNIAELEAEGGPQWNLYLQALRAMYDRNWRDPESFYQIAGIHGFPWTEYNNAGNRTAKAGDWPGYSTHGELLFLTWHRPYVVLFEQALVNEAKILAARYPDNQRSIYQKAAEELRAPYWDWAIERRLPRAVLPETVEVQVATDTGVVPRVIENPLYAYKFAEDESLQDERLRKRFRCDVQDTDDLLQTRYKDWVYDAFTKSNSFEEFGTTASGGTSLESVHNHIHVRAGCGREFASSIISSFEPLFMLHHSNIDRLWAYWQAMHPESSTFNGTYEGYSRFNHLNGATIDIDSPLQPFRQANDDWHTSRSVNSIKTFGYTYEGLEYWTKSEKEMQQSAGHIIRELYGPENRQRPTSSSASPESTQTSSKVSTRTSSEQSTQTSTQKSSQSVSGSSSSQLLPTSNSQDTHNKQSTQSAQSTPSTQSSLSSPSTQPTLSSQSIPSTLSTVLSKSKLSSLFSSSTQSTQSTSSSLSSLPTQSTKSSLSTQFTLSTLSTVLSQSRISAQLTPSSHSTLLTMPTQSTHSVQPTEIGAEQSVQTTGTQSMPQHEETNTAKLTISKSIQSPGNRTTSSYWSASASTPSTTPSSSRTSPASALVPVPSGAVNETYAKFDAHHDSPETEMVDYRRFYADISVDVAYLPVRPCIIEVSIDGWSAGSMAIMKMPAQGVIHDSFSVTEAMVSAKLDDVADGALLNQTISKVQVALRKNDGSSIDVTQLPGLRVEIEEAEMVAPSSDFELPQVLKSSTHVAVDIPVSGTVPKPVSACAARRARH